MRRLNDEDGVVAVMVGLMLMVLFGFGAIAVDVGALFTERRELQNGADAAVLAVAQNCASGDADSACDVGPQGDRLTTARTFADSNARDGSAAVAGDGTGVDVDYTAARATVTATSMNGGEGFVRHWFTGFFSGPQTTEVGATSTAIWGPVSFGSIGTLPLAFSQCEYDKFLAAGAGAAEEPWTTANNGAPQIIYIHGKAEECNAGPSGQDLPGGFGWLNTTTNTDCEALIVDEWVGVDPGASPSQGACSPATVEAEIFNKVVFLPVFNADNGLTGNNAEYRIYTYAAFYVTGYSFGGQYKTPTSSTAPCSGSDRCIAGWFTTGSVLDGVVDPGAPDLGVRTVQLVQN